MKAATKIDSITRMVARQMIDEARKRLERAQDVARSANATFAQAAEAKNKAEAALFESECALRIALKAHGKLTGRRSDQLSGDA